MDPLDYFFEKTGKIKIAKEPMSDEQWEKINTHFKLFALTAMAGVHRQIANPKISWNGITEQKIQKQTRRK